MDVKIINSTASENILNHASTVILNNQLLVFNPLSHGCLHKKLRIYLYIFHSMIEELPYPTNKYKYMYDHYNANSFQSHQRNRFSFPLCCAVYKKWKRACQEQLTSIPLDHPRFKIECSGCWANIRCIWSPMTIGPVRIYIRWGIKTEDSARGNSLNTNKLLPNFFNVIRMTKIIKSALIPVRL